MTTTRQRKGQCLCGSVQVTAQASTDELSACHCDMCRRWGGGPFIESDCGAEITFAGEDFVSVFQSSDWAERGFCSRCGTHLFYRLRESQQHMVPVGLFDADESMHFAKQVFIDEKPPYYSFKNDTKELTGAELFALFAPPE